MVDFGMMLLRFLPFRMALCLFVVQAQSSSPLESPHFAPGSIAGGQYRNDAAGVRMRVPPGWSASLGSADADVVDPKYPESPLNRCSQPLLSLHNEGANKFQSFSLLFALNPACFPSAHLPASPEPQAVRAFAGELVKIFRGTMYIPPTGVDFGATRESRHLFVFLEGSGPRNTEPDVKQAKVDVHSLISVTESGGCWIVWVSLVDDDGKKQLSRATIQFAKD